MALTLTVISRQSQSLGPSAVRVFDRQGGSIGRAAGNDWVLPDPSKFVSSRHANIEVVGADYFLCDLSTNGTFVNGAAEAVGYGSKVRLSHGDRIQIGEYEVAVTVTADQPGYPPPVDRPMTGGPGPFDAGPSPFAASAPPAFGQGPPPPPPPFAQTSPFAQQPASPFDLGPPEPQPRSDFDTGRNWPPPSTAPAAPFGSEPAWDPLASPGAGPQDPLDILSNSSVRGRSAFGAIEDPSARYGHIPPAGQGAWQDSDPMQDHFAVPPAAPDLEPHAGQIPADWDKTSFEAPLDPAPRPPVMPPSRQQYPAPELPADWDSVPEPVPVPVSRPHPSTVATPPPAVAGVPRAQRHPPAPPPPSAQRVHPAPPAGYASPGAGAPDTAVLQRILETAGMDPAAAHTAVANPELADTLGHVLQLFVDGMMDVLRARSEVKDTFKLQHTVMRPVENNPLKFFPSGREALAAMFSKHGSGYLSPVDATQQAFDDTKAHQMAMMAGMQAAFESLMKRFHPETLQREFEQGSGGGMFKGRNKAKYWDGLVALYDKQMRNPDESFRRLFGEPFAEAYEEQMTRLTSVRRRH